MSLRAIQKRDRNKLSSAQQKQQQQQHQQLFINKSRSSFGATTVTAAPLGIGLSSSVGGHHQHRQQSTSSTNKNEKWRNSASQVSLSSSTSIPSSPAAAQQLLTHAKRSVSYPSLQKRSSTHSAAASLRFTKSESDLYCGRGGAAAGQPSDTAQADLSSANNLYLGAKSEVCLKTLAVKSTHQPPAPFRRQSVSGNRGGGGSNRMYESNRRTSDLGPDKLSGIINNGGGGIAAVRIPIIGYEVMEERARFTIFKLRIENSISHTCWLVLRRYTDFVRLHNRLRLQFAHCQLVLPRKKWFGDNFSSGFIDNRIQGLQTFINTILEDDAMRTTPAVREFFCLDEPPAYSESMEESRIIFEAQEETISHLKQQLQTKDELVAALQAKLASEINRNKVLTSVIRNSFENCSKCAKQLDNHLKDAAYK